VLGIDGMQVLWAVEDLPNMVFVKDADGLRFVYMNREGEALLGIPRSELLGKSDYDILPAEQADFFTAKDREVLASGIPMLIPEEPLLSPTRGPRVLRTYKVRIEDASGRARYLLGVSVDITDVARGEARRREAEEALARREARFRALIESASDLTCIVDGHGSVRYAGPSHARVLGRTPDELAAVGGFELVHPEDREKVRGALTTVLEDPTARPRVVYRLRHKDGGWRTLESTATNALADPDLAGIILNSRDITDQVQLQEQYLQAQKMDVVGQLAGGIAHDFNNLLSVIAINAALLLDDLGREEGRGEVQEILGAAQTGAALTRQLLAFSRRQVFQPVPLDIGDVVRRMETLLRRTIGEDVALELRIEGGPDVATVLADRGQMEQVLLNLCVNARDAMPTGGTITITVSAIEDQVVLEAADTGVGMSEETRARVFEPFFTTKRTGTGLGLATVYGIVQRSGGRISVHSAPGKGTRFRIALPRFAGAPTGAGSPAPRETPRGQAGETVLLVEDEPRVRVATRRLLASLGYAVLEAQDGEAALALAAGTARIDLVLTDMVMPKLVGPKLAELVLALRPDVPIVFMTGYSDTPEGTDLPRGSRVLTKPFTVHELATTLREVIDGGPQVSEPGA
jgi:PAS domain S-box-containing protein